MPPRVRLRAPPCSRPARRCLPLTPSNCVDAASGWRSLAAVPQHSGPFSGGGMTHRATKCQVPQDHPPCHSSCSAGVITIGQSFSLRWGARPTALLHFLCIRVMAAAVVTYDTSSFGSARYRVGPLSHVRIRVSARASASESAMGRDPASGRTGGTPADGRCALPSICLPFWFASSPVLASGCSGSSQWPDPGPSGATAQCRLRDSAGPC